MRVNLFTGYCPTEMYGLSRYDRNIIENLSCEKNVVCIKSRFYLPIDIIRYSLVKYPEAEINHITNQTFGSILERMKGKKVITVHDLAVLDLENEFSYLKKKFYENIVSRFKYADKIIASSKFTKEKIKEILGIEDEKIDVVYLGVENKFFSNPKNFEQKDKYQIIYVGSEKLHKNFIEVLKTMKILKEYGKFKLIKIGKAQSNNRKMHVEYVSKNNLDVEFIEYADDSELIKLYRESNVFITMSDYEGFCFPPLEAAACGIPLVLKKSPTLEEIYGKVGYMVNGPQEAANAILDLISSKSRYNQSASKANEYAKQFTWKKCVRNVENIYEEIV